MINKKVWTPATQLLSLILHQMFLHYDISNYFSQQIKNSVTETCSLCYTYTLCKAKGRGKKTQKAVT